jgi:hypothetical protein
MKPREEPMIETHNATLDVEDEGAFRALTDALKRPRDDSHGIGDDGGNGSNRVRRRRRR